MSLAIVALRRYVCLQGDSSNACLHAGMQGLVLITTPDGFPGAGEVAVLTKALYGSKQGSRRYYDRVRSVLLEIGFTRCPAEPCLYRYVDENGHCFILVYVDDTLLFGTRVTVNTVKETYSKYFKCKRNEVSDFTGHDLTVKDG